MKFQFRLEKVRRVRESEEMQKAEHLREVQEEQERIAEVLEDLERVRKAGHEEMIRAHGGGVSAAQLGVLNTALHAVERAVESTKVEKNVADLRVQAATAEFLLARGNRMALDRLAERQEESWKQEQIKSEEKENEEISRTHHTQRKLS